MRPAFARTSSAASGLRFCGMIEEPVVNLSDSAHEADQRRRPHHDLLGEPRQMHGADRRRRQRLQHEIAVGDGVERIRRRPVEAERLRGHVAIEIERGAGKRRRAERRFIEPLARIREAPAIARRHLDIGQKMMAEGHRLRGLQMRQPRHHGAGMVQRLLGKRALKIRERADRAGRWCRAPTGGNRSPPGRCASARCAAARRPDRRVRSGAIPHSYARLPARAGR